MRQRIISPWSVLVPLSPVVAIMVFATSALPALQRRMVLLGVAILWAVLWPRWTRRRIALRSILRSLARSSDEVLERAVTDALRLLQYSDVRRRADRDGWLLRATDRRGRPALASIVRTGRAGAVGMRALGALQRELRGGVVGVLVTLQDFTPTVLVRARRSHVRLINGTKLADSLWETGTWDTSAASDRSSWTSKVFAGGFALLALLEVGATLLSR